MKSCAGMRDALVRIRTLLVNTVRGWMRGRLIKAIGGATENFPQRLRTHLAENNLELPPYVDRQLEAIEGLSHQICAADLDIRELAKDERCRRLMTIPGVGPVTAVRFLAGVDQIERFGGAHELESYFGLTPGEASSSETKHRTGLTKAGSTMVRWLMVQAAWSASRSRPNDPMVLWAMRISERKGNKQVAIVALARKMIGVMFALLRDRSSYNPARASSVRKEVKEPRVIASGADVVRKARANGSDFPVPPMEPPTNTPRRRASALKKS
jgi:transposase